MWASSKRICSCVMLDLLLLYGFPVRSGCYDQILGAASVREGRRGQVQGLRRESHPSSGCLDDLHNLEEQLSLDSEELDPITGEEVGRNLHIEGRCTQAEELSMRRAVVG